MCSSDPHKIFSDFTTFGSSNSAVLDSEHFLDHHSVSIMASKPLHGTIVLQQSDLECLKWLYLLMWMYKATKYNFYVSSSINNDLKTCSYVGFCSISWLQALLKNFLWVKTIPTGYLKALLGSRLYIGNIIMVIQLTNLFLFMKTFIPPPKCRIWKSLLYIA